MRKEQDVAPLALVGHNLCGGKIVLCLGQPSASRLLARLAQDQVAYVLETRGADQPLVSHKEHIRQGDRFAAHRTDLGFDLLWFLTRARLGGRGLPPAPDPSANGPGRRALRRWGFQCRWRFGGHDIVRWLRFLLHNLVAEIDTLIADVHLWACDELADLVLRFSTE